MSLTKRLKVDESRLIEFCAKWSITELSLFGSVLRSDFRSNSDVDVLLNFQEGASPTLLELTTITEELEVLFGRRIDVVTRRAVENSVNWIRREDILESAQVIYAA